MFENVLRGWCDSSTIVQGYPRNSMPFLLDFTGFLPAWFVVPGIVFFGLCKDIVLVEPFSKQLSFSFVHWCHCSCPLSSLSIVIVVYCLTVLAFNGLNSCTITMKTAKDACRTQVYMLTCEDTLDDKQITVIYFPDLCVCVCHSECARRKFCVRFVNIFSLNHKNVWLCLIFLLLK